MIKKFSRDVEAILDDAAKAAFDEGKGNRVIGGGAQAIAVGDAHKLLGVTHMHSYMRPTRGEKAITEKEWEGLTRDERTERGELREWFAFITDKGTLSFTAVMGENGMTTEDYWATGKVAKAEDFDPAKIIVPSARVPRVWAENEFDDLIGKTIKCVATKEYKPGGQTFDVRVRAWVVVPAEA